MASAQDILSRLNDAKPVASRLPFISAPGTDADIGAKDTHTLVLCRFFTYNSAKQGPVVAAELFVDDSRTHKPGTLVIEQWFVSQKPEWPNMPTPADRAADFICKLLGDSLDNASANARKLIGPDQPGRGIVITCNATRGKSKNKGKAYVDRDFQTAENSPEQIAKYRSHLDRLFPLNEAKDPEAAGDDSGGRKLMPKPDGWPPGVALPDGFYDPATHNPDGTPKAGNAPKPAGGGLLSRI